MISESLINTIVTSSITGAGLIFVAYNVLIPFCEKLREFRLKKIDEMLKKIDKKGSTEKLREVIDEIERTETQPFYLSAAVYAIFIFYILSVITGVFYLISQDPSKMTSVGMGSVWLFIIATTFFGLLGMNLLSDILEFMRNYLKFKEEEK